MSDVYYLCEDCHEAGEHENCWRASDIRVLPDTRHVCEGCFESGDYERYGKWLDLPSPTDENATLRAQLAEANAKLAVAVGALEQAVDSPLPIHHDRLTAQAARMLAVVAAARDVAMKYDDFSEPERGAPREYNERRRALYDALHDFDANREPQP